MFLFSITCSLGPSSSWLWLIPVNSGPWETWLDLGKRVDRECWCDVQILPMPFSANIQGVQLGEHFVVRQIVSIFLLEFPVFFIVEVCVCVYVMFHGWVYFLCFWGAIVIFHFTRSRLRLHPLQTPDPLLLCPSEQCPRLADGRFSVFCTQRQSCPTGLYVSVGWE